ncbi:hypothetical protein [Streptosporangium sp. NPDC000396]|uniref:hypothetical protein n=1 Tax=Streptosporangium sp. NPDC000396 TaxID=3366185 RepID=UPI0036C7F6BE
MTTVKVTTDLRDRLAGTADEYGGATLADTVRRLVDEHEERTALAAYERLRADLAEWASYVDESRRSDNGTARQMIT